MYLICKKVQKPLDHFKAMQEENLKDEAIVFDDIELEETRSDSREIEWYFCDSKTVEVL